MFFRIVDEKTSQVSLNGIFYCLVEGKLFIRYLDTWKWPTGGKVFRSGWCKQTRLLSNFDVRFERSWEK